MTQAEIERMLIEVVCQIQEISGREGVDVTSDTRPVLDMPGFDSLNGVESTIELSGRINKDVPFNNIFVEESKALSIRQAGTRLLACINGQK